MSTDLRSDSRAKLTQQFMDCNKNKKKALDCVLSTDQLVFASGKKKSGAV